jgi:hypothetical protein
MIVESVPDWGRCAVVLALDGVSTIALPDPTVHESKVQ